MWLSIVIARVLRHNLARGLGVRCTIFTGDSKPDSAATKGMTERHIAAVLTPGPDGSVSVFSVIMSDITATHIGHDTP